MNWEEKHDLEDKYRAEIIAKDIWDKVPDGYVGVVFYEPQDAYSSAINNEKLVAYPAVWIDSGVQIETEGFDEYLKRYNNNDPDLLVISTDSFPDIGKTFSYVCTLAAHRSK